jgi:hypothetical protein
MLETNQRRTTLFTRKIFAKDIVSDVRSGMKSGELMQKYRLSRDQLNDVLDKLFKASSDLAKKVSGDILLGMLDSHIMEKYQLSKTGLERSLQKLVELGLIDRESLYRFPSAHSENILPGEKRRGNRSVPSFYVRVIDRENPCNSGQMKDISYRGLGITGMQARLGEDKVIAILGDDSGLITPFEVRAECRWVSVGRQPSEIIAGFQIRQISDKDLSWLKEFIDVVRIGGPRLAGSCCGVALSLTPSKGASPRVASLG